jgi:hypothetical protein
VEARRRGMVFEAGPLEVREGFEMTRPYCGRGNRQSRLRPGPHLLVPLPGAGASHSACFSKSPRIRPRIASLLHLGISTSIPKIACPYLASDMKASAFNSRNASHSTNLAQKTVSIQIKGIRRLDMVLRLNILLRVQRHFPRKAVHKSGSAGRP